MELIGRYRIAKMISFIDDKMGYFTREEIMDAMQKRVAAGEEDQHEADQLSMIFDGIVEFTEDFKVKTWFKIPEGISEEELQQAVESGEVGEISDGYFLDSKVKNWKEEDGKFFYDTEQQRELLGEPISSWDELVPDANGLLDFGGMMKLEKI